MLSPSHPTLPSSLHPSPVPYLLGGELLLELVHLALGVVDNALGLVDGLDALLAGLVLLGVHLSVLHHVLDLVLAEAAGRLDHDWWRGRGKVRGGGFLVRGS